jgi:hypothetical protein
MHMQWITLTYINVAWGAGGERVSEESMGGELA